MTSFVLRTAEGEDLGLPGFARHEDEWPPAGPNDRMFVGFPDDPKLLDDPRGRFVADHKSR